MRRAAATLRDAKRPAPRALQGKARRARPEELDYLAGRIEAAWTVDLGREARALTAKHGLTIRFGSGTYIARMMGVSGSATEGERAALRAWARSARREAEKRRAKG